MKQKYFNYVVFKNLLENNSLRNQTDQKLAFFDLVMTLAIIQWPTFYLFSFAHYFFWGIFGLELEMSILIIYM